MPVAGGVLPHPARHRHRLDAAASGNSGCGVPHRTPTDGATGPTLTSRIGVGDLAVHTAQTHGRRAASVAFRGVTPRGPCPCGDGSCPGGGCRCFGWARRWFGRVGSAWRGLPGRVGRGRPWAGNGCGGRVWAPGGVGHGGYRTESVMGVPVGAGVGGCRAGVAVAGVDGRRVAAAVAGSGWERPWRACVGVGWRRPWRVWMGAGWARPWRMGLGLGLAWMGAGRKRPKRERRGGVRARPVGGRRR